MNEVKKKMVDLGDGVYAEDQTGCDRSHVKLTAWVDDKCTAWICLYPKTLEKFLAFIEKVKDGVKAKKVVEEVRRFVVSNKGGDGSVARGHIERLLKIIDSKAEESGG